MIQQLQGQVGQLTQQLKDKEKDLTIKAQTLDLDLKREIAVQAREDYKAETQRMKDIYNTADDNTGVDPELKKVVDQLIRGMLANGELNFKDEEAEGQEEEPPMEGAMKSPKDGLWYVENPEGGYSRVDTNG
jgi:hypothetical protein